MNRKQIEKTRAKLQKLLDDAGKDAGSVMWSLSLWLPDAIDLFDAALSTPTQPPDTGASDQAVRKHEMSHQMEIDNLLRFAAADGLNLEQRVFLRHVARRLEVWDASLMPKPEHITHPETAATPAPPTMWIDGADIGFIKDGIKNSASLYTSQVLPCMVPLYTHPQDASAKVAQDAEDAARYRWIRENFDISAERRGFNDLLSLRNDEQTDSGREAMDRFTGCAVVPAQDGGG